MRVRENVQTNWGWLVAVDHFLSGAGAGLYFMAALMDLFVWESGVIASKLGVGLGVALVLSGSVFLFLDLGVKYRVYRAYTKPKRSWISRGIIIITGFLILGAVHFGGWIWPFSFLDTANVRAPLEAIAMVFAVCVMLYKGFLLGDVKKIPVWSTPILPALFVVSSLSVGAMVLWLSTSLFDSDTPLVTLSRYIVILLLIESLTLALYLSVTHQTVTAKLSVVTIVMREFSTAFWVGVVLLGIAAPLATGIVLIVEPQAIVLLPAIGFSLGILGGFVLRYIVIFAGIKSPLEAIGITFSPFRPLPPIE